MGCSNSKVKSKPTSTPPVGRPGSPDGSRTTHPLQPNNRPISAAARNADFESALADGSLSDHGRSVVFKAFEILHSNATNRFEAFYKVLTDPEIDGTEGPMALVKSSNGFRGNINARVLDGDVFVLGTAGDHNTGGFAASSALAGTSLVHICALAYRLDVLKSLVMFGADCTVTNTYQEGPLHAAARLNNGEMISFLLSPSAAQQQPQQTSTTSNNDDNDAPLPVSSSAVPREGSPVAGVVSSGPGGGCSVNSKNADGISALHLLCAQGNTDLVRMLVQRFDANVNIQDDRGQTPMFEAFLAGNIETVRALLSELGADPALKDRKGHTALACADEVKATVLGFEEMKALWLKSGGSDLGVSEADRSIASEEDTSQLFHAVSEGDVVGVQALLKDNNHVPPSMSTVLLQMAVGAENQTRNGTAMLELLIARGCNPTVVDDNGETVLHTAATVGNAQAVALLIQNSEVADTKGTLEDRQGRTAIMCADPNGPEFALIKRLLE